MHAEFSAEEFTLKWTIAGAVGLLGLGFRGYQGVKEFKGISNFANSFSARFLLSCLGSIYVEFSRLDLVEFCPLD